MTHISFRGSLTHLDDAELGRVAVPSPSPHLSGTPGHIGQLGGGAGSRAQLADLVAEWVPR